MKKKAVNLLKTILLILLLCIPVLQFGNGVGVQAATKLATPKLVSAKAQGTSKIKVTWKKVSGADGYKVYRKTWHSDDKWRNVATLSGAKSTYTDSKLKSGTLYFYTVKATAQTASSNYDRNGLYAVTALNKVTGITTQFSSDNKGIIISWNKIDRSDGYYVYRRTENTSWKVIKKVESAFYVDKSADTSIQYYYTICPYCEFYSKIYKGSYNQSGVKAPVMNSGFAKLKKYIINNGKVNLNYNRFISYTLGGDTFAIVYDERKNIFTFLFDSESDDINVGISMNINMKDISTATVRMIWLDDEEEAGFDTSSKFNTALIRNDTNIKFIINDYTGYSGGEDVMQEASNLYLHHLLSGCNKYLLRRFVGITFKDLGFENLEYIN